MPCCGLILLFVVGRRGVRAADRFQIAHQAGVFRSFDGRFAEYALKVGNVHVWHIVERKRQEFFRRAEFVDAGRSGEAIVRTNFLALVAAINFVAEAFGRAVGEVSAEFYCEAR